MPILGLTSTETWDAYRDKNVRRAVQYQYPNGKFPLLGLLSIMDTEEETNDPYYSHWEYRYSTKRTLTTSAGVGTTGPILNAASGDPNAGTGKVSLVAGTTYVLDVAAADEFLPGDVVRVPLDVSGGATNVAVMFWVTSVSSTLDRLTVKCINALADVANTAADNVGKEVLYAGKSFSEGRSTVTDQQTSLPSEFYNYPQIFRTPITFTGREMKTPVKFDESGIYKHRVKLATVEHMAGVELAFLFGKRYKDYSAATVVPSTGVGLPTYFTGGILYYLERWEAGDYKTVTATADADDDKRIIANAAGTMTEELYDTYMERLFRYTNNSSNEKLCVCGSGFLKIINQLFRSKSVLNTSIPSRDAYGMKVVEHVVPWGSVYYKTHPLFNENPTLRWNALFLDVRNLKYRSMKDRDTQLLKNRHDRSFDGRTDEWFTDCGLEMWFPETCLYLQNVTSYTP